MLCFRLKGGIHMNLKKYNTDPELLLEQGKTVMSSTDESKYLFRVFAVNMVLSGTPASQVGASAGFTKAAVTGWVKTVDEQGFEALRPQRRSGRPAKLMKAQMSEIDAVIQTDPKEHGFKVWDGSSLSSYIKSHYNVDISVRQCQRMFHSLGFSHIRPQPHPSKGYEDTEERETLKKRDENAENESLTLVYQDEVHFHTQTTVTAGWYKKGSSSTVKPFPGRFKTSYSGFVIPETGALYTAKPEKFKYSTTIDSIRSFLSAYPPVEGKKYATVMDNAPWHKKTIRLVQEEAQPEYADIRASVIFVKLPPYSPDLNPIEQVWRITRREKIHNVFFASLSALELCQTTS